MGRTMEKSKRTKVGSALVFNALVLPGLGHIFLGQKIKGVLLILSTLFFVVVPVAKYSVEVSFALNTMRTAHRSSAFDMLSALTTAWGPSKRLILMSVAALIVIWGYSIADIYFREMKKKDQDQD